MKKNDPYIPTDRFDELDRLDLEQIVDVAQLTFDALAPDLETTMVFLVKMLQSGMNDASDAAKNLLATLCRKAFALGPLSQAAIDPAARLSNDPQLIELSHRLAQFPTDRAMDDLRGVMTDERFMLRKKQILESILDRSPGHVVAASQRLTLDYYLGEKPGKWIDKISPPKFAEHQWRKRLFLHFASLGDFDEATPLLAELDETIFTEIECNLAAEMAVKSGDAQRGIELYQRSLDMDPLQGPVRDRLEELRSPTSADMSLVDFSDVAICLYSWNKADMLEKTLRSLAKTAIGPAKIRILLNGCTDHSLDAVESCRRLFPDNDFELVVLQVNVGAPAARNWLGSLPEVRTSEFVAYLDDDVELPTDWLARYLTVMRDHPKTSAVGCKVVYGDNPRMIQYLHRTVTLAQTGMIKLTEPNRISLYDIGQYDFVRSTDTVMGCCHLLRMEHMPEGPQFDLRYSPSQVDDIAHDIALRVRGGEVRYCGLVKCVHHQNTGAGFQKRLTEAQKGQVLGNDTKFYYAFMQHFARLREMMREHARR